MARNAKIGEIGVDPRQSEERYGQEMVRMGPRDVREACAANRSRKEL